MQALFPSVLMLHVGAGLLAVLIGLGPILTRKGSALHRWFGRAFTAFMGVALVAAWVLTALRPNLYFAALSATATLQLVSGVRVLRRKRPDIRSEDRAKPIDWLVSLAAAGVGAFVLWRLWSGGEVTGPRAVAQALGWSAVGFGGWDLWRFLKPAAFPFFPDLWFYEHLVRMLGAYAAVLSAFAGNGLPFVPEPWRQLWPIVLLQGLTVVFILRHAIQRRRPRAVEVPA
jgi:uncharacterized membrane protein